MKTKKTSNVAVIVLGYRGQDLNIVSVNKLWCRVLYQLCTILFILMRNMKKITLFLLLAAMSACQSREIISLDSIPSIPLSGKTLTITPEVLAPRYIYVTQGALALFDSHNEGGFLSFFDKTTGLRRDVYGIIGRGPGEYLIPRITETQKELILTSISNDVYKIEFADSLSVTPMLLNLQDETNGANFLFNIDESSVILVKEGTEQLTILDKNSGEKGSKSYYPVDVDGEINPAILNNTIFQAHYNYHQDERRLFIAYQYHPIISVVDVTDYSLVANTQFDGVHNSFEKDGANLTSLNPTLGYTFTSVSDHYFYALYQNANRETLKKYTNKPEIHKYDLSGKFIERFSLDRSVYNFTVERNDSRIYALSLNQETLDAEVVIFELPVMK